MAIGTDWRHYSFHTPSLSLERVINFNVEIIYSLYICHAPFFFFFFMKLNAYAEDRVSMYIFHIICHIYYGVLLLQNSNSFLIRRPAFYDPLVGSLYTHHHVAPFAWQMATVCWKVDKHTVDPMLLTAHYHTKNWTPKCETIQIHTYFEDWKSKNYKKAVYM